MSSVPLKRTAGIERAATITVGGVGALGLLSVLIGRLVVDDAEAFLDGDIDQDEFLEAASPYLLLSFVQGLVVLASAVLVMIWMHRLARNHRTLHRGATWGPGWAVGGWFLPPLLYIIPFLMFRELWRASDPEVPVGGDWKSGPVSPLVAAWFVLYSVLPLGLLAVQSGDVISSFAASETDMAEQISGGQAVTFVGVAVSAVAAIVFIVMARQLGRRHRQLTGEQHA